MRILAFDGRTGAAGDMILGALIAAGADPAVLTAVEDAIPVDYVVGEATRGGITGTDVTIRLTDTAPADRATNGAESPQETAKLHRDDSHVHPHDHCKSRDRGDKDHGGTRDPEAHGHDRDHDRDHDQAEDHQQGSETDDHGHHGAEGHGPTRPYPDVVSIVEAMDLPNRVRTQALSIFELLGEAEAEIHGTDLDATAFHEVGADDAIADVVGAALLVDNLDPDRVVTTPVAAGGGEVTTAHGTYPVPPPAVLALAERADWSLTGGPVDVELLTPTGAAILAQFAEGVDSLPPLRIDGTGYGTGAKDLPDRPNVLRAVVGTGQPLERQEITVLETNLDDASPEVIGGLQESLTAAGARDVTVVPTTMKKSRPGHLVKVVVDPADAAHVARRLAAETGTLGVRQTGCTHRFIAKRSIETVTLTIDERDYEVGVKVATDAAGNVLDYSAEYDDAAAVAAQTDRPVRTVLERAERRVRENGT